MKILLADNGKLPALKYGGTERVIWYLAFELNQMGHSVNILCAPGSKCDFAGIIHRDETLPLHTQIPEGTEIVHFNYPAKIETTIPVIFTNHGNRNGFEPFDINTVFVSKNHAERYGSDSYVHNGLNWNDYPTPDLNVNRHHFHFLGNAAWKVKNLKGAIDVVNKLKGEKLAVLGGHRLNLKMGFRFTLNPKIRFYGMVGGEQKSSLLNHSKGLIFPVKWHEPFGLAIIESMYYGCAVFGTPYGSLPELIGSEFGCLKTTSAELADCINHFDFKRISSISNQYARDSFNSRRMANDYLKLYEKVISGKTLNPNAPVLKKAEPKYLPWG